MTEAKHTPGPWAVDRDLNIYAGRPMFGTREAIADTYGTNKLSECDANARLIAAAPELLDALRRTRKRLYDGMIILGSSPEFAAEGCHEADAAIAKATNTP
jgi:hypothetical protein